ncbi:MAG TPA: serine hydrolase domain-containing protein [Caulobacteraceae bacterium]
MRAAFAKNFAERDEVGAAVAVTIDGELVVDLWGGWTDRGRAMPWTRDSVVACFSSTKTAMALCALLLADRGELDVDAPVARYWPGFQAREVTTRHCLAHTSGLARFEAPLTFADLFDWERITGALARQQPWWPPGTAWAYHALTQGYLVGEVVRRIAGESLGTLLRRELADPLDADFHIGLDPTHDTRIVPVIPLAEPEPEPPPPLAPPGSLQERLQQQNPSDFSVGTALEEGWRRAEIPAGNGFGNARGLARLQSALACGGAVGGRRYLSEAGALAALSESWRGPSIGGGDVGFGLGFALDLGPLRYGTGRSCFWGGAGGSMVVVDFDQRMSFAYTPNRLGGAPFGDRRNLALTNAIYAALNAA